MEPNKTSDFRYWAFISYSSKDAALAKRFHRALERYRVPRTLVGRPGRVGEHVPRSLFPVFRDRDELPLSSDLGTGVQDALRASRYLIVICSRHASRSRWVNEEIRFFKSLGRDDRILAIIIDGEPNASDCPHGVNDECFPPALRYKVASDGSLTGERCEPVGGDLRLGGDGWTSCVLKAVAAITGMGYNAFVQREQQLRKQRRLIAIGALLILSIGVYNRWNYKRTTVEELHFDKIGEKWGVPCVDADQFREDRIVLGDVQVYYRFESRGNKVRKVSRFNRDHELIDDPDLGAAVQEMLYREDGSLSQIILLDHNGVIVASRYYSQIKREGDGPVIYVDHKRPHDAALSLSGAWMRNQCFGNCERSSIGNSEITTFRVVYDEFGRPLASYFVNSGHKPRALDNGLSGQRYIYKEMNLIGVEYLGTNGTPLTGYGCIAKRVFKRDSNNRIIEESTLDSIGHLVDNFDGYARITFSQVGDSSEKTYYDSLGNLAFGPEGYARIRYPSRLFQTNEFAFCGTDGQLMLNNDGYARRLHIEIGPTNEILYFGVSGQLVTAKTGYARKVYDLKDESKFWAYYGTNGEPVIGNDGYARVTIAKQGRCTQTSYWGVDGRPIQTPGGFAKTLEIEDKQGRVTECSYYGVDGLLKSGLAISADSYDMMGNIVEHAWYDRSRKLIATSDGWAKTTSKYDSMRRLVEQQWLGTNGNLVLTSSGYAKLIRCYDDDGHLTAEAWYGVDGMPVVITNDEWGAAAKVVRKYNYDGDMVESSGFGVDDKPLCQEQGIATIKYRYDDCGNVLEMAAFGANGNPVNATNCSLAGISTVLTKYDEAGRRIEESYFDMSGKPVCRAGGYAKWSVQYDRWGNTLQASYYGADGKLTGITNEFYCGLATERFKRNEMGRLLEVSEWDAAGNLVCCRGGYASVSYQYDDHGCPISDAYYDQNGRRCEMEYQISQVLSNYQGKAVGLQVGDVLVSYDGRKIESGAFDTCCPLLGCKRRDLVFLRNGKEMSVSLLPGKIGVRVNIRRI